MTKHDRQEDLSREVKNKARSAVTSGKNIHDTVRDVTLEALSTGSLNAQKTREMVQAVLHGASLGAAEKDVRSEQALREAMCGVDEALAKSAEASRLAIEEAAGRVKEFGSQDLRKGLEDLSALEDMFLDTLGNVALASRGAVRDIMNDLARHARNTGTAVGATADEATKKLLRELGNDLRERVNADADTARETGRNIAMAAAGFLEGIARAMGKDGDNAKDQ